MSRFERFSDLLGRAAVATLFLFLSINLLNDFQETRRITGLLLLVSEGLIVVLMIVRRRATFVDRSTSARIVTALSVGGPPLLRTAEAGALVPDAVTATASAVGLGIVIAGKVTLGRSFGIVPANRGIVARGPYAFVRHPIYLGYILSHAAFLAAHPTLMNLLVWVMADSALIWRALMEERVLVRDEQYRSYCDRVAWHVVPGIY